MGNHIRKSDRKSPKPPRRTIRELWIEHQIWSASTYDPTSIGFTLRARALARIECELNSRGEDG